MAAQDRSKFQSPRQPSLVRRMTFSYEGDKIMLVSEQQVKMILPPSQPIEKIESTSGFSVVVLDKNETPIYRRVLENPIRHNVEIFSQDPAQSIRQMPMENPKGTFVVLVPELPNARHLEFIGHPPHPEAHLKSTKLLARFPLKEPPKGSK